MILLALGTLCVDPAKGAQAGKLTIRLDPASDSGWYARDGVTNKTTLNFNGVAPADARVVIVIDGSDAGEVKASSSERWSFTASLNPGWHHVRARIGKKQMTLPISLFVDTTPPSPTTLWLVGHDDGPYFKVHLLDDPSPQVAGDTNEDAETSRILVREGDVTLGRSGEIPLVGDWLATLKRLSPGAHEIVAVAQDAAGNESAPSEPITLVVPSTPDALDLADLDGRNGFRIVTSATSEIPGTAASGAGDLNGDGLADIVLAAPQGDHDGSVYVVFGRRRGFRPTLSLDTLNGRNGFRFKAPEVSGLGNALSGIGDINGDGIDDLAVAAGMDGTVFVIYGRRGAYPWTVTPYLLDGKGGFVLKGGVWGPYRDLGSSVHGGADVNGDGLDDMIVGSGNSEGGDGKAVVLYGSREAFPATIELADVGRRATILRAGTGASFGTTVRFVPDINGDGVSDMAIASPFGSAASANGVVTVVFGRKTSFPPDLNVSRLPPSRGFKIVDTSENAFLGRNLAGGDVNGDGAGDLLIGNSNSRAACGSAAYLVYGEKRGRWPKAIALADLPGRYGARLETEVDGTACDVRTSVAASDHDGDGIADIVLGLPGDDLRTTASASSRAHGSIFVVRGTRGTLPAILNTAMFGKGERLQLVSRPDAFAAGTSIADAGDVNGDGVSDLLVGAPGQDSGSAFVVFGRAER